MHTREQHINKWTKEMVKVCYDNSFARLVEAFVGEGELGEDDQEALKRLLQ